MDENNYRTNIFLSDMATDQARTGRNWTEHQQMQIDFLRRSGLTADSVVLDVGCGPLRLGIRVIESISPGSGHYFGFDINQDTLNLGLEILTAEGISSDSFTLAANEAFDLGFVERPVDIAFANSVFSHLSLNSILRCLLAVRPTLASNGTFFSTYFEVPDLNSWLDTAPRNKWGHAFATQPGADPYHYSFDTMAAIAKLAGFDVSRIETYGHPTQTMLAYRPTPEPATLLDRARQESSRIANRVARLRSKGQTNS